MSKNQTERNERALHDAEVRLWVEERELELLADDAPAPVRADLEAEVARLRGVVDAKRADVERHDYQVTRIPRGVIGGMGSWTASALADATGAGP